ncbi:MAG: NADH-quinone oxidoreductase subunit C [Pseudomonadota bacterium]
MAIFDKIKELVLSKIDSEAISLSSSNSREIQIQAKQEILIKTCELLKNYFNSLVLYDIIAVDKLKLGNINIAFSQRRFETIYHLFAIESNIRIFIRIEFNKNEQIESLSKIFPNSLWYESELFDFFGIETLDKKNNKRIFTHEHFKGYPHLKDYDLHAFQECINPNSAFSIQMHSASNAQIAENNCFEIGFNHRGIEKIAESLAYKKIPFQIERLSFLASTINTVAYVSSIEKLLEIKVPKRARLIRVLLMELSRILSHLACLINCLESLNFKSSIYDLVNLQKKVMTIFKSISSSNYCFNYIEIGGFSEDIKSESLKMIALFIKDVEKNSKTLDKSLKNNLLFSKRTKGVGIADNITCLKYGITGPNLRAASVSYDVRQNDSYYYSDEIDFSVTTSENGDVYDRIIQRIEEIRASLKILKQISENLPEGRIKILSNMIIPPDKYKVKYNIEAMINHFMLITHNLEPKSQELYFPIENPNGELGFYIISDGSSKPYRLKIRSSSFANFQCFTDISKQCLPSDHGLVYHSLGIDTLEMDR